MAYDVPWLNPEQEESLPKEIFALHIAATQKGVKEVGNNWGPTVKLYLKAAGVFSPAPWCAAFVTWCLKTAGYTNKFPKYPASTLWWVNFAKENKIFKTSKPQRGDLFVWNIKGQGHIGFIAEVQGQYLRTIEGNTNDEGSREGYEVCERTRTINSIIGKTNGGFIRLGDLK